ncbi:inhibitor of growth protein 4 isoform X2 [Lingula anatina]|uniref:Inhibitor of growth protein n=1 Tax=Lingula anatina TaxID=7574 RepID=A0A1S3K9M0_LINAN|nr:inhibitor of growth protein 4 isoform X1 [Lingula anatina]XP_013418951.1 inhibitor of growth protein 4 isoform X2 [Lingula anatina]|eukprot:XP_013418950.1 inhibitor of growth protein 4 isoform X1 [Lingula anatina]
MATAMYLEHYLDSLECLPMELQRNFNLMRDLDQRSQDVLKDIDKMSEEYLKNVKHYSSDKRTKQMDNIKKLFGKSREYGDDKVQLAMQTYEMVDKHIRRLDSDLARFEAELKEKTLNAKTGGGSQSTPGPDTGQKKKGDKSEKKRKKGQKDDFDDEIPRKKKKKNQPVEPEPELVMTNTIPALPLSIAHPSDVLDMPVDPNEPTYCLCHQVSYGEMIGCDNPDCPIEWFHFACVGLTTKPKGKWFCPKCTAERKKK